MVIRTTQRPQYPNMQKITRQRIAIVSTPRCGNTWLRRLFTIALHVTSQAVHRPQDLDWSRFPERCVLQLHWPCEAEFRNRLALGGFRIVTMARHPLDVLLSILHFCNREPETNSWLDGLGGTEDGIRGCTPLCPQFREYALSPRAKALLGLSRDWQSVPGTVTAKFEELVENPEKELTRILISLGLECRPEAVRRAVSDSTLTTMKSTSENFHYWQGQPGLWRSLLPAEFALEIADVHRSIMEAYSYDCNPDPALSLAAARENWDKAKASN